MAFKMKGPSVNISYGGESAKQEKSNLMKDNPVAKHASAMNMSVAQDTKLPEALQDELSQEGRTSPATMVKKVVKPKFKKVTELQPPIPDNVISPLNNGKTRNSGDKQNLSDAQKAKIIAKNAKSKAWKKKIHGDKPGFKP
jgi:hypothetical protein